MTDETSQPVTISETTPLPTEAGPKLEAPTSDVVTEDQVLRDDPRAEATDPESERRP